MKDTQKTFLHFIVLPLLTVSLIHSAFGFAPAHKRPPVLNPEMPPAKSKVERQKITILHTNDLHSHFRPDILPPYLGGVARFKTLVSQLRKAQPNTLLVDGGDWSEGDIYYQVGAGTETIRMMDELTYDVAVVGNHDWLNGPDLLVDIIGRAKPKTQFLAANIDTSQYHSPKKFKEAVPPYTIKRIGGIKVAFIGMVTDEFIYDGFFKPVKITSPYALAKKLSEKLAKQADLIIVLSHNSIVTNEKILKEAPLVDFVVGAHDHKKLIDPIRVERGENIAPGYLLEAGCWNHYVGKLDLLVAPRKTVNQFPTQNPRAKEPVAIIEKYELLSVDSRYKEDEKINERIELLEKEIIAKRGPVFDDHQAHSHIHITRGDGLENTMGNLATDAYRISTGADLALDQVNFLYRGLPKGAIHSADVFNANPAIFNPITEKTWTLKTFDMKGITLAWLVKLLYSSKRLAQMGILSVSGMEITFQPVLQQTTMLSVNSSPNDLAPIESDELRIGPFELSGLRFASHQLLVKGKPLKLNETYRVAAGGGIIYGIEMINSILPNTIPLTRLDDTGVDTWKVLANYLKNISPVTIDKIPTGNRIRTQAADLGILSQEITWKPLRVLPDFSVEAEISVVVHNFGQSPSHGGKIELLGDLNKTETAKKERLYIAGKPIHIPPIPAGESIKLSWIASLRGEKSLYPVIAQIYPSENDQEINQSNNKVKEWLILE